VLPHAGTRLLLLKRANCCWKSRVALNIMESGRIVPSGLPAQR
jgi:hypothetical protein